MTVSLFCMVGILQSLVRAASHLEEPSRTAHSACMYYRRGRQGGRYTGSMWISREDERSPPIRFVSGVDPLELRPLERLRFGAAVPQIAVESGHQIGSGQIRDRPEADEQAPGASIQKGSREPHHPFSCDPFTEPFCM